MCWQHLRSAIISSTIVLKTRFDGKKKRQYNDVDGEKLITTAKQQIDEVNYAEYQNRGYTETYEYWYQVNELENTKTIKEPESSKSEKRKANKVDGNNAQVIGFSHTSIGNTGPFDYLYQSAKQLIVSKRKKPEVPKNTKCEINDEIDKNERTTDSSHATSKS